MAKQQSVIQFTGKVGELVGQKSIKGDLVLRKRANGVRISNSMPSLKARASFLAVSEAAKGLKNALFGLTHYAKQGRMSKRNAFMKLNYGKIAEITQSAGETTANLHYTGVSIAKGDAIPVIFGRASVDVPEVISITYTPNAIVGITNDDDRVYLVAYNPAQNMTVQASATRADTSIRIEGLPSSWSGQKVQLFGFVQQFTTQDAAIQYSAGIDNYGWVGYAQANEALANSIFSNSVYLGEVTVG